MPILLMLTPRRSGPMERTVDLRYWRSCLAVMSTSLLSEKKVLTVDCGVVFGYLSMRITRAAQGVTGHSWDPVLCCVMVASFSPFFWSWNVMDTQCAVKRVCGGDEWGMRRRKPVADLLKKRMSQMRSSFVFLNSALSVVEYSQERMAKKRAPRRSCPMAMWRRVVLSAWMVFQTVRGRHAWCFVGGSVFLYALICFWMMIDLEPEASMVGSGRRLDLKA